jgi:nicotinate-nucleotide adenylyltransferase
VETKKKEAPPKERIGVMGGSFNPIHSRHLDLAACAQSEANLSRVLFLPTGNPPHKKAGLAPAEDRFEMTRLALIGKPLFTASRMELDRSGIIYTLDTLRLLKKQFPSAELFYIIGEDTLLDLPNWHQPDEVFALCHFLVSRRLSDNAAAHPLLRELEARGARFTFLSLPPLDISSTNLRQSLSQGQEPDGLLPQVMEYIRIMGLYGVPASPARAAALYPILRAALSDKRLLHSLLVAYTARDLARHHGQDPETAALAGLLHDCAKCLPLPELQRIAKEQRLLLDKETLASQNLLHGPVGAALAQARYGIDDPNILSSIGCHTVGKVGMLPLDMILYLADKIEPSRALYPALLDVRALAREDLVAAMGRMLKSTLEYVAAQKTAPHPSTQRVADWLARLTPEESKRSEAHE